MSGKIDLLALLERVDDYVLILWKEFPSYAPGSDVDLVVFDQPHAIQTIHQFYDAHLREHGEMLVTDNDGYCHIDFYLDGEFDLRIDLIDGFNFFEKIAVKPAFMTKLFTRRKKKQFGEHSVFVPAEVDELTLRYFEYLEWFDRGRDKIKHLEYICEVDDEELKRRFFENTHRFIQFKRKTWPSDQPIGQVRRQEYEVQSRRDALRQIWNSIVYLIVATLRQWKARFCKWFSCS